MVTANRYHDFSAGHRVYGHESKCAHLHGHNYRVHFQVAPLGGLDSVGRVLDFSVIKSKLCEFLEQAWDHKTLIWNMDPWAEQLREIDPNGIVIVPFNPTAENMAQYLVDVVGPNMLVDEMGCYLKSCIIEETRKCSVSYGDTI